MVTKKYKVVYSPVDAMGFQQVWVEGVNSWAEALEKALNDQLFIFEGVAKVQVIDLENPEGVKYCLEVSL